MIFIHAVSSASGALTAVGAVWVFLSIHNRRADLCVCVCVLMGVNFHKSRAALITSPQLIFTLASLGEFLVTPFKYRCVLADHTCALT